jgi:hypothetical protein
MCRFVADAPDDDLAGVEPHPDTHLKAMCAPHRLGIVAHGGLHRQRRIAGPQGMVFMGDRCTEEGHDAIAQHLVHGALVAVHSIHHMAQSRVQQVLRGFGIEISDQFGGVFEVGKYNADLLAFAFEGGAGCENLFGEVLRCIGERGSIQRMRRWRCWRWHCL